jgi:tetratricopeptide (TPR) repeat protein
MAPPAQKITRKDLRQPDEFQTFTAKVLQYFMENRKKLASAAGVVVFLLLAVVFLQYLILKTERKGNDLARTPQALYINQLGGGEAQGNIAEMIEGFEKVIATYPRTDAGRASHVFLGELYVEAGKYDKAKESLEKALENFGKDPDLARILWLNMAFACEGAKEYPKAAEWFSKLLEGEDPAFREEALYGLARVKEQAGESGEAQRLYAEFAEKYPDSVHTRLIREKIGPVQSEEKGAGASEAKAVTETAGAKAEAVTETEGAKAGADAVTKG